MGTLIGPESQERLKNRSPSKSRNKEYQYMDVSLCSFMLLSNQGLSMSQREINSQKMKPALK